MLRKLGIGFIALAAMTPGLAAALGVGEYELNSYLNQPLDMEIALHESGSLSGEEVVVNLAPQAEFDAAGVERGYFLNGLTFDVTFSDNGEGLLHIRSQRPVREPYLNFLVEILWPTGRLVREYTVLLDPPSYGAADETVSTAQVQPAPRPEAPKPRPVVKDEPEPQAESETSVAAAAEPEPEPEKEAAREPQSEPVSETAEDDELVADESDDSGVPAPTSRGQGSLNEANQTYRVQASDTLWRIAAQHRPAANVSVQQMMMAIQDMNPEAFIDGNINLVREGAVLRLPGERQATVIASSEAMNRVAEQTSEWRQRRQARQGEELARAQLDATDNAAEAPADDEDDNGRVTLVTPEASDGARDGDGTGTGGDGEAATAALQNELAIRDENLDRMSRENDELRSRIDDLDDQLHTSEEMLSLQNEKIAALQEALRKLREDHGDQEVDEALLQPAAPAATPESPAPGNGGDAAGPVEVTPAPSDLPVTSDPSVTSGLDRPQTTDPGTTPDSEPRQGSGDNAASVRPVPSVPAPAQPTGWLDWVLGNLLYLGAGLVLILLALLLVLRRRGGKDDMDDDEMLLAPAGQEHPEEADTIPQVPVASNDDTDEDDPQATHTAQDPLDEVEVYVAYGRYPQAVDFLRNEINQAPGRTDLKERLLEVLSEMGDDAAFRQQVAMYAGSSVALDRAIERLGGGAQTTTANESAPVSLDDLELDLASDLSEAPSSAAPSQEDSADDTLNLDDFEFSLDDDSGAGEADGDDADALDNHALIADDPDEGLALDEAPLTDATLTVTEEAPARAGMLNLDDLDFSADDAEQVDAVEVAEVEVVEDRHVVEDRSLEFQLDDLDLDGGLEIEAELPGEQAADEQLPDQTTGDAADETFEFSLDGLDLEEHDAAGPAEEIELTDMPDPESAATESKATEVSRTLEPAAPVAREQTTSVTTAAGGEDEDDFDFLAETDENATKLDLARAYIEMGDMEGARDILNEVIGEGSEAQRDDARELLARTE